MARLIDLIQGRRLPVRVRGNSPEDSDEMFEIVHHERGFYFGFWEEGGADGYEETDSGWELCPDQPEVPTEEVRPGFRKVKRYMGVSVDDPAFHDKTEDALNVNGMNGYVEFDVWVKE